MQRRGDRGTVTHAWRPRRGDRGMATAAQRVTGSGPARRVTGGGPARRATGGGPARRVTGGDPARRVNGARIIGVDPKHGRTGAPSWSPLLLPDAELL